MVKSYDYIVASPDRSVLQSEAHNSEELNLARAAVERVRKNMSEESTNVCFACGSQKVDSFFKKWGVKYFRCANCESVFTPIGKEALETYHHDAELMAFRIGNSYQNEATERRKLIWDELIDWISFRSFRYLGKNKGLAVTDIGDFYRGLIDKIQSSGFSGSYTLKESILGDRRGNAEKADIVLSFNRIQRTLSPKQLLSEANEELTKGGLLFLSARMGTGFDILTLKANAQVYPFEYVFLPSEQALVHLLGQTGFILLDYSTPGQMDVGYVMRQYQKIDENNFFIRYLLKHGDKTVLGEFQRFLQKSRMSSYAHIVARKEESI